MTGGRDVRAFPSFALIWALATLVHQLSFTFWLETWQGWLLTFTACAVIVEPRCLVRFTALVCFALLNLGHKLPFVPNHMLFEGMLNLSIFLAILSVVWRHRSELPGARRFMGEFFLRFRSFFLAAGAKAVFLLATEAPRNPVLGGASSAVLLVALGVALGNRPVASWRREDVFHELAPILRIEMVVMYFWAVIQKLNWDYLNPEVSCAAELHREIAVYFPFLPTAPWALHGAIYGSLLFEFGIPILLMVRRTRPIGFLAGILFHFWLAIHPAGGIYSFSALLMALYFLFLPRETLAEWSRFGDNQIQWMRSKWSRIATRKALSWIAIGAFLVVLLAQAALYVSLGRSRATFEVANRLGFLYWLALGTWLGSGYLLSLWRSRGKDLGWPNRPRWSLAWLGVVLVVANGLNPWIGLKTQTSFSMYSNLRSEGAGNHLFLRRVDLFPFQLDLVELVASEPDLLAPSMRPTDIQQYANRGNIFPYFELRRLVSEHEGDLRAVYRRGDREFELSRIGGERSGDPRLFEPIPFLLSKLLWFRRSETLTGPMPCTH